MLELLAFLVSMHVTVVHLSFDDGPHPLYTKQILEILKESDYQANFFLVGSRVIEYPGTVKEILSHGHDIGGHSMTHKELTKIPLDQAKREILESMVEVNKFQKTMLFRFPYGSCNKDLEKIVTDNGYERVDWDVDTTDWKYHDDKVIYDKFKIRIKRLNENEAIVLMHDIHPQSVESLKLIVKFLKDNNIKVTKLPQKPAM